MQAWTKQDRTSWARGASLALCVVAAGCAADTAEPGKEGPVRSLKQQLEQRAYVVNRDSDELTVIDLDNLEIVGTVRTGGVDNHMAELNADFTKIYVDSSETHETIVVDARTLEIEQRISVGTHPTHLTLSPNGKQMWIMAEDDNALSILDLERGEEIKRIGGFFTPHFARFSADGKTAYVANIGAHHLTRVNTKTLEVEGHIVLDGFYGPPETSEAPNEGGFADAQIDEEGMLYAAHNATGKVLVYDTVRHEKREEIQVGAQPWMVYAHKPFPTLTRRYVVPNFGDESASVIDGEQRAVIGTLDVADRESFGVNYSPLVPNEAFLMNRFKQEIAVIDTDGMALLDQIDVGGTTETAATSADGKYIVAAVSSAGAVVVIDAETHEILKRFEGLGEYPWSVTIPHGQNYCH